MKIHEMISLLPEDVLSSVSLSDPDCEVFNISFLTSDATTRPRGDVLYFSDSELVPELVSDDTHFNCVVVDQGPLSPALTAQPNVNLVALSQGTNLFTCYNTLQNAFIEGQAQSSIVRRLLNAHFSNQGLQYLIEEAANALHNPIVVVDPTYHYVAYHLGDLAENETDLAKAMTAEIANETLREEGVAYIRDSHIDSEIARSKGPYVHYNELLCCKTMTMAVMVRGVCIAHVMMMEVTHPFSDLDHEVFVRLTGFVAQEMQKSEVWGPTSGELGSYFLENLLNDRSPSVAVTARRMKALDFHPKPLLYVVCLHAPGEGLSQMQTEHVAGQLRPMLHHAIYTRHHQQLVALVSRDKDVGFSKSAKRKLREVALLNGLSVGVSNIFTNIIETRGAYEQARTAIRMGEMSSSFLDDRSVYCYCDYAYAHLITLAGRRTNLFNACHPALQRLVDYDAQHGGELVETLYCYLQVACSTARAAKMLNLHKNTMLYRLGRIREVLDMDLSSGENLFILQVSFRVLMNLGLFAPRLQLDRQQLCDG
ncbi:MAG: helix-turn-helix domain-containing protein [Atopobiaceae bacterium]|nr:helix-turn-helix domain-containing protein [Atopobiaceae bacterium]